MKILNRYVLREHAGPLVFAAASLTSLLLLNFIAKNIGQLVGKGLPWTVIAEFVGLSIPFTVAMTLPMAVLVAVLYAFSRLASENEITALKASGVSVGRILIPVVLGGCVITGLMVAFNDQVLPRANHRLRTLQSDIARKKPTFALRPRVINEVQPGKLFLNATHIDQATSRLRDVIIYDLGDPTRTRTIYADSGLMALSPVTGELELTLFDGSMSEVTKASPGELQRLFYRVDLIRVKGVGDQLTRSTNDDFKSDREMTVCELQQTVAGGEEAKNQAITEVRQIMVDGVRAAATGVVQPRRPSTARPQQEWGVGRVYCNALTAAQRLIAGHRDTAAVAATSTAPAAPYFPHRGPPSTGSASPSPDMKGVPPAPAPSLGLKGVPPAPAPSLGLKGVPSAPAPSLGLKGVPAPSLGLSRPGGHAGMLEQDRPDLPKRVLPEGQVGVRQPMVPRPLPPMPPVHKHLMRKPVVIKPIAPGVAPKVVGPPVPPPKRYLPSPTVIALQTLSPLIEAVRSRVDQNVQTIDTYDNQIQKMFAIAFACVIFVFLGAPIALRFPRGGVGMVLGVSLGVFALYYIGLIAGEPLAQRGVVPPFLAMWTSNIVFGILGAILLMRMSKETATSRGGEWAEFLESLRNRMARGFGKERRHPLQTEVT